MALLRRFNGSFSVVSNLPFKFDFSRCRRGCCCDGGRPLCTAAGVRVWQAGGGRQGAGRGGPGGLSDPARVAGASACQPPAVPLAWRLALQSSPALVADRHQASTQHGLWAGHAHRRGCGAHARPAHCTMYPAPAQGLHLRNKDFFDPEDWGNNDLTCAILPDDTVCEHAARAARALHAARLCRPQPALSACLAAARRLPGGSAAYLS